MDPSGGPQPLGRKACTYCVSAYVDEPEEPPWARSRPICAFNDSIASKLNAKAK